MTIPDLLAEVRRLRALTDSLLPFVHCYDGGYCVSCFQRVHGEPAEPHKPECPVPALERAIDGILDGRRA